MSSASLISPTYPSTCAPTCPFGYRRIAIGSARTPGKSSRCSLTYARSSYLTSTATGTAVYGETRGSSSFLRISVAGFESSSASRFTTIVRLEASSLRSIVITFATRLSTSTRFWSSRIRPRIGGSLTVRTELLCAAAAYSLDAAIWRYQRRAKSALNRASAITPTMLMRTRFSITTDSPAESRGAWANGAPRTAETETAGAPRTRSRSSVRAPEIFRRLSHHPGLLISLPVRGPGPRAAKPAIGNTIGATMAS